MTTELTNQITQESEGLSQASSDFFDISLRQDGETMFDRAYRTLDYFSKLSKQEQELIEYQHSSLLGYLREVGGLIKFKR